MPTAGDPSLVGGVPLPISHNPLQRLNYTTTKPPVTLDDLIEALVSWVENILFPAIKRLTGIDLAPLLPILKNLVDNLEHMFGGIGSGGFDPIAAAVSFVENILKPTGLVLGPGSPLNPAQLAENLWQLGVFPAAESIAGNGVWVFDPTVTRTADSTGSLRVIADGTMKAIKGVETAVVAGQQVNVSVFVKWDGYAGTGAPIQLQIAQYNKVGGATVFVGFAPVTTLAPTTAAGGWAELAGTYTAVEGVNLVRGRLMVTPAATAGTIHFDDASARNKIVAEWVAGLPEGLQSLLERLGALTDTLVNGITGGSSISHTLEDLLEALHIIPPDNVQGAAGPATIFDSIFGVINAFLGGAVGAPGATGGSLADVTNVAGEVSSNAFLGGEAWRLANILNNTPVAAGMLPTGRANYDITSANTFISTTQSAALSATIPILQAMPIGVISWYGYGNSGMTAFYINIRKVNPTTGVRDLVHHSSNFVGDVQAGSVAADADWMFCQINPPLAAQPTDTYYVEYVPVGGTHHIRGMSFTDTIKDHPLAAAPCVATVVNYSSNPNTPASSLPKATAGPDVPWTEYAVSLGSVADHHEPKITTLQFDAQTVPIPSWCNRLDLIPLSGGGKGHAGAFDLLRGGFLNGQSGEPGNFAPITYERDVHWSGDGTLVTFNILAGGNARLSIPGYNATATAGADGATAQFGLQPVGRGPGILDYNGQKYTGGVDQNAWGGAGADPGGAGNGGRGMALQAGGVGGKPVGFVCFRQVEVVGELSGGDTTPPNIAALDVAISGVTAGGFTLTPTGAVDE